MKFSRAFSGFSVDDTAKAKQFYGEVLGVEVEESPMGLELHLGDGHDVFVYPKPSHEAATYTILNFMVDDIDAAVEELAGKGVQFEKYDDQWVKTDEKGVARNDDPSRGPAGIAWFKDPAGNILAVLQVAPKQ